MTQTSPVDGSDERSSEDRNETGKRFRSQMSDGRPTVGFDDGAEIFDTEADADRAAWLLHQAFSVCLTAAQSELDDLRALLTAVIPYMSKHGPLDNWECEHGFHLDECPNDECEDRQELELIHRIRDALTGQSGAGGSSHGREKAQRKGW